MCQTTDMLPIYYASQTFFKLFLEENWDMKPVGAVWKVLMKHKAKMSISYKGDVIQNYIQPQILMWWNY